MKWLVFLLLLANGLLFGYFKLESSQPVVVADNHLPLLAEKVKLLTPQELEAMPKKVVEPPPPVTEPASPSVAVVAEPAPAPVEASACYEWGSFSRARAAAARSVLKKLNVIAVLKEQASAEAIRYWVYHPKLANEQAALAKADELHNLGIKDLFVVQEPQWKNAISFGVFKDEQLATKLLTELQLKGVSAVKGVRNQEKGQVYFVTKQIPADVISELEKSRPNFPGSEIKQAVCQ